MTVETDEAKSKARERNGGPRRGGVDRERLLEIAAELFSRHGYKGVSLEDVASRLGVKKTSLYYYIDSKQKLLVEIFERWLTTIDGRIRPIAECDLPPDERLRRMIHAYVELATDDVFFRTAVNRVFDLEDDNRLAILRRFRNFERLWENVIVAGQKNNLFKPIEPRLAVLALLGMCDAVPIWSQYIKFPPKQIAAEFCLVLETGIHADAGGRRGAWPRPRNVTEALASVSESVERLRGDAEGLAREVERARQRLDDGLITG